MNLNPRETGAIIKKMLKYFFPKVIEPKNTQELQNDQNMNNNIININDNTKNIKTTHEFNLLDVIGDKENKTIFTGMTRDIKGKVKLFIIDPPFGILNEEWDKCWSSDQFNYLLNSIENAFTHTPVLLFHCGSMIPIICEAIKNIKYKIEFLYWHQVNYFFFF